MSTKLITAAVAAILTTASIAPHAHAWGAYHAGYTHVGPSGVQHYGYSAARTPYGSASTGRAGAYGYGGASYHAGYGSVNHYGGSTYGGYRPYTPSYGGGYSAGGYHYNTRSYGVYGR